MCLESLAYWACEFLSLCHLLVFRLGAHILPIDICEQHSELCDGCQGAMHLMRHPNQKGIASCLLRMLDRIDDLLT